MPGPADDTKGTPVEGGQPENGGAPVKGAVQAPAASTGELETLRARLAEYESKDLSESQRLARDLAAANAKLAARDASDAEAKVNESIVSRAQAAGARYPKTVPALLKANGLELDKAGNPKDLEAALASLRKEMPDMFRPAGSADGGAGNSAPAASGGMNAWIRAQANHNNA
jgi:hypothetical protein